MRTLTLTATAMVAVLSACGGGGTTTTDATLTPEQANWMQWKALTDQCHAGTSSACDAALQLAPADLVAQAKASAPEKKQADLLWILIMGPFVFPYPGPVGTGTHTVPN